MGKEWLYWIGVSGGGGGRRSSGRKDRMPKKMKDAANSAGCMCAVFQLFDLHHFQSPHNQEEPTTSKGFSLECNEPPPAINNSPMTSSAMKDEEKEENLNFPVGKIQIKASRSEISSSSTPRASTCGNSPAGTKTPGLVARLMGLDLLPPECTTRLLGQNLLRRSYCDDDLSINGARSSPARRSDVEYHSRRLSLQIINKENVNGELENMSPGHSAKHFVKQVKGKASRGRAFGLDITNNDANNSRNREQQHVRRDENLIPVKPTKKKYELDTNKNKQVATNSGTKAQVIVSSQAQKTQLKGSKKVGDSENCNYSSRFKNKKDPSPPPTKLPLKQSQVSDALSSKRSTQRSSKTSHSYKQLQANVFKAPQTAIQPDSAHGCAAALTGGATAEYGNYILKILKLAGVINKPDTSSHSIDPSIFHTLELFRTNTTAAASGGRNTVLSHRCNRTLIFQLVNELLTDISRPHFNSKPWISPDGDSPLVDELCKRIDSFPAAHCVVLEDVDTLIDRDLRDSHLNGFFGEEENVVREIEVEIMELLLSETAAMMGGRAAERRKQVADATW